MPQSGKVYLVGAGPGDPGLLTIKGLECLRCADLILYDGLVNPLLLRHTVAQAERTCRSALPRDRRLRQDEINQRLIDAALAGKTVVRLKGGDPFIFGRGSEEAAALTEAGIPFEVVPGITAATAVGAYTGISVTHREFASAVAFVTGHEDPTKEQLSLDYRALAGFPGTLVFYMGLHRIETIVDNLLKAGKDPHTPAAVVSKASFPAQRTVAAALEEIAVAAQRALMRAPSLIIVGESVQLRGQESWFERLPLFGSRIGITRPIQQAGDVIARCLELGAQPVCLPMIQILPPTEYYEIDATLERLAEFDWILFTSVNGVHGLLKRHWERGNDVRSLASVKLAAIGPSTAAALHDYRLRADLVPESFHAEALAAALAHCVAGKRVLWARANRGRDVLPDRLCAAGARVEQLVVYQNLDMKTLETDELRLIEKGELEWIGLSSPSIARNLKNLLTDRALAEIGQSVRLASISPLTSSAAREVGLPISAEAVTFTWDGILEAISAAEAV